jgi:membrane protein YdbS with pleckstrin-like domain
MSFPRKLLIPNEEVVVELRPHWVGIAIPELAGVGATILALWLTLGPLSDSGAKGIVWLVWLLFVIGYPMRRLVWWFTSQFVVTTSRVIHREGFFAKRSMEIPLDKINDVRFEQNIFERIVGAGTLVIQSASETGRNEFSFIRHPEEVQRTIYHESELDQTRSAQRAMGVAAPASPTAAAPAPTPPTPHAPAPPATTTATVPAAPNVTTELERLADLRSRGVLTEEEFQAQKAKILGPS